MIQVVCLAGAAMVVAAYALLQFKYLKQSSRIFNLLNFVGSALLGWVAIVDNRWGFIILESVWCVVTLPALYRSVFK